MTVLQMRDTDEGTTQPPQKKLRLSSSRLKTEDTKRSVQAWLTSVNSYQMSPTSETMVDDYDFHDSFPSSQSQNSPDETVELNKCLIPIAPLLNLGNTCFLNSVLYTLRFAPSFLHRLHHLNSDSMTFTKQINASKQDRTYSLGRNLGKTSLLNSKESLAHGSSGSELKTQTLISKLHQLYLSLTYNEHKDRMEPFQAHFFLKALRDVNPIFEGNQQHDAHELLVCLLDSFREACEVLYQQNTILESQLSPTPSTSSTLKSVVRKSLKLGKMMRSDKGSNSLRENHSEGDIKKYLVNGDLIKEENELILEDRYNSSQTTLFDDFQGISILRTTCLECEQVTERKETFCDICVPIQSVENHEDEVAVDQLYQSIIVTEEYLVDCNKYWCERCSRYNEAKRCVRYEKLPRLLTLHLKRFSSNYGTCVSKVNEYMPTPFTLSCFCEECIAIDRAEDKPHFYQLYAVIMHLGVSIVSGHYVAYVKQYDNAQEYLYCTRDKPKTSSLSRNSSINSIAGGNSNTVLDKSTGLLKYFKLSSKSFSNGSNGGANSKEYGDVARDRLVKPTCKGAECCSIRVRTVSTLDQDSNSKWLECDDDAVRNVSMRELTNTLGPRPIKNPALTPYLLFYARTNS